MNLVLPTVDVVVPCYNYGRYLAGCVRSVLSQPGVAVRVLVIDDHSSDDSEAVGRALSLADPRVEFRRHAVNHGHIRTYNEGLLDWSNADYCVLLSADDLLAPGSLERAVGVMQADAGVGMVYGRSVYFEHDREVPAEVGSAKGHRLWTGRQWIEDRCRAGHNVISSPEVVVRGCLQRAVGGYRTELPHTGDLEMWLRIAARSNIAYVRGVPQAYYRVHGVSMQRTVFRRKQADLEQRRVMFDTFFAHHGELLGEGPWLQRLACRALAREALWEACRAYDRDEVEEAAATALTAFALDVHADAPLEREYAALQRRRRLGPAFCRRTQLFALSAAARRIRGWLHHERWKRQGI